MKAKNPFSFHQLMLLVCILFIFSACNIQFVPRKTFPAYVLGPDSDQYNSLSDAISETTEFLEENSKKATTSNCPCFTTQIFVPDANEEEEEEEEEKENRNDNLPGTLPSDSYELIPFPPYIPAYSDTTDHCACPPGKRKTFQVIEDLEFPEDAIQIEDSRGKSLLRPKSSTQISIANRTFFCRTYKLKTSYEGPATIYVKEGSKTYQKRCEIKDGKIIALP